MIPTKDENLETEEKPNYVATRGQDVESSNVEAIGYDDDNEALIVYFKNGTSYAYEEVPEEVYEDLCKAESIGRTMHSLIKPKYKAVKLEEEELKGMK